MKKNSKTTFTARVYINGDSLVVTIPHETCKANNIEANDFMEVELTAK